MSLSTTRLRDTRKQGGGISLNSPAIFRDCIIRGNTTQGYGGAIYCSNIPITVENCLIVDNSAGVAGGGVFLVGSSNSIERILRGCTISNNDAPTGAGIYNWRLYANTPSPPLTIENCIIANNKTSQAVKCDNAADPVTVSCSDIYGNEGGDWTHCIYGQNGIDGNFSEDPRFCNIYGGNYTLDSQSPCLPENNGCEVLIGVYGEGCDVMTALPGDPAPLPGVYNFPNPFNPETQIVFALTDAETITIRIFDSTGRVVRDLIDTERYPAGSHSVHWQGLDDTGRPLPSGVYHCRIAIGQSITSTKMTLLK